MGNHYFDLDFPLFFLWLGKKEKKKTSSPKRKFRKKKIGKKIFIQKNIDRT